MNNLGPGNVYRIEPLILETVPPSLVQKCQTLISHSSRLSQPYNTSALIRHTVRHLLNYSVGVVVVDEAEYVTAQFSGGDSRLLFFWINLMNCSGIPLVLIANPEFEKVVKRWLKAGLRFSSGGNM